MNRYIDHNRQTGRTTRMLEEALEFVEPEGDCFVMTIVGATQEVTHWLLRRFAGMLRDAGLNPQVHLNTMQVTAGKHGNTLICFRPANHPCGFHGRNAYTTFEDHTVLEALEAGELAE